MKCNLVILLASTMASVNSCEFRKDAIQSKYDRFELFRKTKAFDPTDPTVPLTKYKYESDNSTGTKHLSMEINGDYMWETYKSNNVNEIETINGRYDKVYSVSLTYERDENGVFALKYSSKDKKLESTIRSFDDELPDNFDEDIKKALLDLNTLRQKMFSYQKSLSKQDFTLVRLFEFYPYPSGGFYAQYFENDGDNLSVYSDKKDGKETISGRIYCFRKYKQFTVVDGKVAERRRKYTKGQNN